MFPLFTSIREPNLHHAQGRGRAIWIGSEEGLEPFGSEDCIVLSSPSCRLLPTQQPINPTEHQCPSMK